MAWPLNTWLLNVTRCLNNTKWAQVVGQLLFGVLADQWSRKNSLLVSTIVLVVFTALATGSYYHGNPVGMFNMLTAWRFFVSQISSSRDDASQP